MRRPRAVILVLAGLAAQAPARADNFAPAATGKAQGRLPMLSNDDAWRRLPGAPPKVEPLPAWARMLAGPLPKTTALMLELDAAHRTGDRLDPALRARMRWAAADANRSAYAMAAAEADLRRVGATSPVPTDLPEAERLAVAFARKLTADATTVTDAEVKRLVELHGDAKVVAMVALVAHACFQDRMLLALNPPVEPGGPPAPVAAHFPHERSPAGPPPKPGAAAPVAAAAGPNHGPSDAEWRAKTFSDLQAGLERQRDRPARVRIPDWKEVEARIGPDAWVRRWPRVVWGLVCYAHQPEVTDLWFDVVDAFRQETKFDRFVAQDMFWVVTRVLDCFY
jgi:alkylhydroperoxidase family enzyme